MKKTVYISGQVSGLSKEDSWANFHQAEMHLVHEGYKTINPLRFTFPKVLHWLSDKFKAKGDWAYKFTLLHDLYVLAKCDYIYKMPGWKDSVGAQIESCWAFNLGVWTLPKVVRERVDKRMTKWYEKQRSKNDDRQSQETQP